ncbi:MAG: gamma carbonic anhydrase family protein [Bryobacterales bacterium]|nr:gamma carbonic anhydrase family protein [Bryobacterales bacterium]MBV9397396.1 gamma carbonic anhydrase family protein [Bryobacterales bacterium]
MLRPYRGISPRIATSAYIDHAANLIGDVTVGERSTVWPNVTIRGDIEPIQIGEETNIQDGAVMHTDRGFPLTLGNRVTIGHSAVLHGCTIEDEALIGIGAIVLSGARIGRGAVVAAGSLVPEGMEVPAGTLVVGTPAKPRRRVNPEEQERFRKGVDNYVERGAIYKQQHESESTGAQRSR